MKARDSARARQDHRNVNVIYVSQSFNASKQPQLKFKYTYNNIRRQSQAAYSKKKDSRREELTKSFIE